MTARALEVIGERWSLLIVRDLLLGPRRFTDLQRSLAGITATRLTGRLRWLEEAGVVAREPAESGREVWYRLTDAGLALGPTIDALTLWGIEHARAAARRGRARPFGVGDDRHQGLAQPVSARRPATASPGSGASRTRIAYTLRAADGTWQLTRGGDEGAAVTVDATRRAWAAFLTSPRETAQAAEPRRSASRARRRRSGGSLRRLRRASCQARLRLRGDRHRAIARRARLRRLVRDQDRRRDHRAGEGDAGRHQDGGLEAVEEGVRGGLVQALRKRRAARRRRAASATPNAVPTERCALSAIGPGTCAGSASARRLA